MSDYRRCFVAGGTFFFTLVTERRARLFTSSAARRLLGNVMRECFLRYPVEPVATVLLPEHLHTLWTLPPGDDDFSMRWRWIKREFTRGWLARGGEEQPQNTSRSVERRRGVWQRRFWEHMIRNESDMEAHFDYIHYNPVKHHLVSRPRDWKWSTFHRWVRDGHYTIGWGGDTTRIILPGNAGE
ncbi:MAG: transposase [Pirellulales bacterium]|nr:transposase [Pirellulales bacterium]